MVKLYAAEGDQGALTEVQKRLLDTEDLLITADPDYVERGPELEFANETQEIEGATLRACYCGICGFDLLVTDARIPLLPRRGRDDSICFDNNKWVLELKTEDIDVPTTCVKRPKGVEFQVPFACRECGAEAGYRSGSAGDSQYTYIYSDLLKLSITEALLVQKDVK
ncbi:MAG: hypothetical protein KVP17_002929 [Porospora cf. gigantea B]|uniref:uncharacterized protein n=1 Tax=Porospora cf. gigantea B TaxID=2853592 RepID=UPI003571A51D|nr:MAG: hypothetical protein KVP17_002929 [Porospora cf. gigantea B]